VCAAAEDRKNQRMNDDEMVWNRLTVLTVCEQEVLQAFAHLMNIGSNFLFSSKMGKFWHLLKYSDTTLKFWESISLKYLLLLLENFSYWPPPQSLQSMMALSLC